MPDLDPGLYRYAPLQPTLAPGQPVQPCPLQQCRLRVILVSRAPISPRGNISIVAQEGKNNPLNAQQTQMVGTQSAPVMWQGPPGRYVVSLSPNQNWNLKNLGNDTSVRLWAQDDMLMVLEIEPDPWIEIRVVERETAAPDPTDVWGTKITVRRPTLTHNTSRRMPAALPPGADNGAVRLFLAGPGDVPVVKLVHPSADEVWEVVDVEST